MQGVCDGRQWKSRASICAVALLLSLPALLTTYGFTDDYSLLWKAGNDGFLDGQNAFLFLGRPLTSLVLIPALKLAGSVANLGWLRLAGLAGLMVYALVQDRILQELNWRTIPRVIAGILSVSSPAAMVWMDWAVCFPYAWGAVAGLLGGFVLVKETRWTRSSWLFIVLSVILLMVALCTYQPAATTFLVPLMVMAFQIRWKELAQRMFKPLSVFIGTHLVYLTIYKVSHLSPDALNPLEEKLSIGSSLLANGKAFLAEVLPTSFSFWGSVERPAFLGLCLCLVLVAAFLPLPPLSRRERGGLHSSLDTVSRLVFCFFCMVLSMASVLATEGIFYHRTRFGLYVLVAIAVGEGVRRALLSGHQWKMVPVLSGAGFTLLAIFGAGMGSWFGIVEPNASEFRDIRTAVENHDEERLPRAFLLIYEEENSASFPLDHSYEFGTTSRNVSWAIEPMVDMILNEGDMDPEGMPSTVALVVPSSVDDWDTPYPLVKVNEEAPNPATEGLVAQSTTPETILGKLIMLPGSRDGWVHSSSYGFLNTTYWNPDIGSYIYHLDLGWLLVPPHQDPGKGINLYQSDMGWMWTSPSHYPNLFLSDLKEWGYIQIDPYGPTYLLLEKSGLVSIPSRGFDDPGLEMGI